MYLQYYTTKTCMWTCAAQICVVQRSTVLKIAIACQKKKRLDNYSKLSSETIEGPYTKSKTI